MTVEIQRLGLELRCDASQCPAVCSERHDSADPVTNSNDLQPLNKVTIRDTGLPPIIESFVEPFAGRQCYTVFDLHWGFDARKVHPESRDLSAFLTPLGLLRITSLPTGFTNSGSGSRRCQRRDRCRPRGEERNAWNKRF